MGHLIFPKYFIFHVLIQTTTCSLRWDTLCPLNTRLVMFKFMTPHVLYNGTPQVPLILDVSCSDLGPLMYLTIGHIMPCLPNTGFVVAHACIQDTSCIFPWNTSCHTNTRFCHALIQDTSCLFQWDSTCHPNTGYYHALIQDTSCLFQWDSTCHTNTRYYHALIQDTSCLFQWDSTCHTNTRYYHALIQDTSCHFQ